MTFIILALVNWGLPFAFAWSKAFYGLWRGRLRAQGVVWVWFLPVGVFKVRGDGPETGEALLGTVEYRGAPDVLYHELHHVKQLLVGGSLAHIAVAVTIGLRWLRGLDTYENWFELSAQKAARSPQRWTWLWYSK